MLDPDLEEAYVSFVKLVPDQSMVFMNHGLFSEKSEFDWIRPEDDTRNKYSLNMVRFVIDGVDLAGKKILEIGCGRGGNCSYLARYTGAEHVTGMDLNSDQVEFCRQTHQLENLSFVEGDAQNLPFENEQFDVVINIESSHCYPNLEKFYREVGRVLKKEGKFCYTDIIFTQELQKKHEISADNFHWGQQDWIKQPDTHEQLLSQTGFGIGSSTDITDRVILSLESKDGNIQDILREAKTAENAGFVDSVLEVVEVEFPNAFKHRDASYIHWLLSKIN
jgi:O-methyltransferase